MIPKKNDLPFIPCWSRDVSPRGVPTLLIEHSYCKCQIQLFVFEDQIREACSAALNPGYQGAQLILRNN